MDQSSCDPRYGRGIDSFNAQAYFQAHEIWESVWMEETGVGKDFYKGLIQFAVCLHHFRNGNTRGARKLCVSGSRYLDNYRPWYLGVDVNRLLTQMQACCAELLASPDETPRVSFDTQRVPTLELVARET